MHRELKRSPEVGRTNRDMSPLLMKKQIAVKPNKSKWIAFALGILAMLLVLGCYNSKTGDANIGGAINFKLPAFPETGSNAIQVFTEMHYQPSFRIQDVPRLLPPDGSVPISGAEVTYASMDDYKVLQRTSSDVISGHRLYEVNCQVCHGSNLEGDGPIVSFVNSGPLPANLRADVTKAASDGELYGFISCGGRQGCAMRLIGRDSQSPMPDFRRLLTEEERWALVAYLRGQIGSP